MSFDLKTPWATHRKYQIFEDKHSDLFARPSATAHRIVLCHLIGGEIQTQQHEITNQLFARYALTRFFILYIVRLIFESENSANPVIDNPESYIHDENDCTAFKLAVNKLLQEIVTDLNAEINKLGSDFDYRGKLRDERWCLPLAHEIAATHKKLVDRNRIESFTELYNQESAQQGASTDF